MATDTHDLSPEQKELVAVGASIGAGCHPCVSHHLKAGAKAGLDDEQLLAAVTGAERVTAEAAVLMADHVRARLGPNVAAPALLSRLAEALASLGAALGANDAENIERQMRTAVSSGATRVQLEQAIETAKTVQENASRIHMREAERLLDAIAGPSSAANGKAASSASSQCTATDDHRTSSRARQAAEHATHGGASASDSCACRSNGQSELAPRAEQPCEASRRPGANSDERVLTGDEGDRFVDEGGGP